jgi:outer membrane protein assembly factor BamB
MSCYRRIACVLLLLSAPCPAFSADWRQFRGPTGQGTSDETGLPVRWSSQDNIVWKVKLPGAGASSPVILAKRVYLTCYSGYGMDAKEPGKQEDLRRHLLCLDRGDGKVMWSKVFEPILPEHRYTGEGSYQGYAASTPITDGEKLYVFFGKSGVFCFDLDGNQLWHVLVGKGTSGWGSGASPMLYKNLLVVNASVESNALVALDKASGKEVWRAPKIGQAWGTPVLVTTPEKSQELVLSMQGRVAGFDPDTGQELWSAAGHKGYVVPSVVAHDSIVYAIGGSGTSLAITSGGRGDVTETHVLWRTGKGSNASSPIYHDGTLYWVSESGGVLHFQAAATGKSVEQRLGPGVGRIWASPILADGKLYFVSQFKGTYVVAARPGFELLAQSVFDNDSSRSNASLAVSNGQLFLRNDQYLYCIGKGHR